MKRLRSEEVTFGFFVAVGVELSASMAYIHVSKVRSSHSFVHAQFNNGANCGRFTKLRPALSPKRRFYSQMAIMATGNGISEI